MEPTVTVEEHILIEFCSCPFYEYLCYLQVSSTLQALGLTGLGALQNQLLQQGLTANDLSQLLTAQANVNTANLGLNATDLGSSVLGNSGLSNSLMGNNSLSSGPLSGKIKFIITYLPDFDFLGIL